MGVGDFPKDVVIDPPNIRTKPVQKGAAIDRCLFTKPGYNALGEPFKPPIRGLARKEDRAKQIAEGHEKPFKPQSNVKERYSRSSYAHMTDFVEIKKNF